MPPLVRHGRLRNRAKARRHYARRRDESRVARGEKREADSEPGVAGARGGMCARYFEPLRHLDRIIRRASLPRSLSPLASHRSLLAHA
jgi:hypothetical protein